MAGVAGPITWRQPAAVRGRLTGLALRRRLDVRAWPAVRRFLLALVVLYLAKQAITVMVFPAFTGHDEVAHYSYLRTVATEGRVPILLDAPAWYEWYESTPPDERRGDVPPPGVKGDWLPGEFYRYCEYILSWNCLGPEYFDRPQRLATWGSLGVHMIGYQYAANHPPLYYILMTPLYWVSDGASPEAQQYLLRAAAIPFGLATVLLAYLLVRALFPTDAFLAVTVPSFVAFQPQISYEAAMVNNDIVAIALYSWILYLLVIGIRDRFPTRTCVLLGFAAGLALLAKGTSLTAVPIIGAGMLVGIGLRSPRVLVRQGLIVAGMTLAVSWPWYAFLYRTYGNFTAFEQLSALQWWNYRGVPKPSFWELFWNRDFAWMRWRETWGEFGWRKIPLSSNMLWAIGLPSLIALAGLIRYGLQLAWGRDGDREDPVQNPRRWQAWAVALLFFACVVAYLSVVQFGTDFELTQARYYFPAVNAVALLLMLGLRTLLPRRAHVYGQALVFAALLLMNIVIYTQYVVPYWHGDS